MSTSDCGLSISKHQRKPTPKTSNLLTCTSRFLAFRFTDCQRISCAATSQRQAPTLSFGVGSSRYSRAPCMISFADCTGSSLQQLAQLHLFPFSCAANSSRRRTRFLRPLHSTARTSFEGALAFTERFPDYLLSSTTSLCCGCLRATLFLRTFPVRKSASTSDC
jgi:hypothetical protein